MTRRIPTSVEDEFTEQMGGEDRRLSPGEFLLASGIVLILGFGAIVSLMIGIGAVVVLAKAIGRAVLS